MSLHQDVTFDSLGAVREEIREWLGMKEDASPGQEAKTAASRDMLVAVLIHTLAEEISNERVRDRIQTSLAELKPSTNQTFAD